MNDQLPDPSEEKRVDLNPGGEGDGISDRVKEQSSDSDSTVVEETHRVEETSTTVEAPSGDDSSD